MELTSMHPRTSQHGFTLVEVLIAISLSAVITSAFYQIFLSQQRSYLVQEQVAEMQQNLRTGLYMLAREMRSAGFDPNKTGNFGFVTDFAAPNDIFSLDINYATNKNIIAFTMDSDAPGSTAGAVDKIREEQIGYRLNNNLLQRYNAEWTTEAEKWETVAANIDALDFVLVDQNGNVTTNPANVAAVEITLLVRTDEKDKHYTNTQIYRNQRGTDICPSCSNGNYHRRVLTTTIYVRNS